MQIFKLKITPYPATLVPQHHDIHDEEYIHTKERGRGRREEATDEATYLVHSLFSERMFHKIQNTSRRDADH